MHTLDWNQLNHLPTRHTDSHKGHFGHALIVGGASGMGGAVALAALAAYRSGAGLITVACHADSRATVGAWVPEAMSCDWPSDFSAWNRPGMVLAIGPGLGPQPLVAAAATLAAPQVWDADALNQLAQSGPELFKTPAARLLTPHPGEATRLLGGADVQSDRAQACLSIAKRYQAICILKGHGTLISDGERLAYCPYGNPGMASGGMGDVLTGILAALLGQGLTPWDAACLGVCLHSKAGDHAAARVGATSLIARDVIEALPMLLQEKYGYGDQK